MQHTALVTLIALAAFVPACAEPSFDSRSCAAFTNTQALGLGWEGFNHRVSLWDVRPTQGCVSDALEAGSIGGDFSTGAIVADTPTIEYRHRTIYVDRQELGATPVTFEGLIGPERRLEVTDQFSRDELGLVGYDDVTAVVRGIRFSSDQPYVDSAPEDLTYDARLGWTMRGVGAGVEVAPNGDEIDVTWWAEFHPAAAPDRPDHNAALPYAKVQVALDVVVIASTDVPVHKGSTTYRIDAERPGPGSSFVPEHAPDEAQITAVAGEPRPQPGFVGLRSFSHTFDIDSSCSQDSDCSQGIGCDGGTCAVPNGEYIRDMSWGVALESYDPETGEGAVRYDGYGSIATPIIWFHDQRFETVGDWVWVQSGLSTQPSAIDASFRTGPVPDGSSETCSDSMPASSLRSRSCCVNSAFCELSWSAREFKLPLAAMSRSKIWSQPKPRGSGSAATRSGRRSCSIARYSRPPSSLKRCALLSRQ